MQTKNSNLGKHGMTSERKGKKKGYRPPRLVVYGDFRRLTKGATGPARDGGAGSPKSKASGSV
jgi:hypothetical protein